MYLWLVTRKGSVNCMGSYRSISLRQTIGKEIYVFDESMNWILALIHEKEVYLSISTNLK